MALGMTQASNLFESTTARTPGARSSCPDAAERDDQLSVIIAAPTVALVDSSMRIRPPVNRLRA